MTAENKKETGQYYRNIVKFLTETLQDKKEEYAKYNHWWSFRMRYVLRKELEKLDAKIDYYQELIAEYKKHGWIQ